MNRSNATLAARILKVKDKILGAPEDFNPVQMVGLWKRLVQPPDEVVEYLPMKTIAAQIIAAAQCIDSMATIFGSYDRSPIFPISDVEIVRRSIRGFDVGDGFSLFWNEGGNMKWVGKASGDPGDSICESESIEKCSSFLKRVRSAEPDEPETQNDTYPDEDSCL